MAAESAQACIETSVELLAAVVQSKLLTGAEARLLGVKRKDFEHGIKQYSNKAEEQYLRYISYDWDLMDLIETRLKTQSCKDKRKKIANTVIMTLGNNINHLFLELLERFPNELKHWALYLQFCRKMKMYKASFDLMDRLIKVHADKPLAFAFAAEWTLMRQFNYELARTYLLQGLHSHPQNHDLYLELLKNELEFTTALNEKYAIGNKPDADKEQDELLAGLNCKLVYESARASLGITARTVPLFKSMLELMREYPFTRPFQEEIMGDVLKKLPDCEVFHNLSAKSHLVTKQDPATHGSPYPMSEIKKCYEAYQTILRSVCGTPAMWSLALDCLETLIPPDDDSQAKMLYRKMAKEAHDKDTLGVKHYITWMKFLDADGEYELLASVQSHVLKKSHLSCEPDIWLCVLKYMLSQDKKDSEIFDLFTRGYLALQDKSLSLFLHTLAYYTPHSKQMAFKILELGSNLTQCAAVCGPLRVKYLEWLIVNESLSAARSFYAKYSTQMPYTREIHRTMYKIEWSGGKIDDSNRQHMDQIVLLACIQLGRKSVDVWIDRVRHELDFHSGLNVGSIETEAKKYLGDSLDLLDQLNQALWQLRQEVVQPRDSEDPDYDSGSVVAESSEVPPQQKGAGIHARASVGPPSFHSLQSNMNHSAYYSGTTEAAYPKQGGHASIRTLDDLDNY